MADSKHREWLAELDKQSRARQASFIGGIAARLGRPRVAQAPEHPYRGAPEFWNGFEWKPEERIAKFAEHFESAGGHVQRLADLDEARAFIAAKAQETGAKFIVRQDQPELASLDLEGALPEARVSVWNSEQGVHWKARAAEADFGVVVADYAIAYTGSIAVLSGARQGRSVSLLPTALFAIIPAERMLTRLGEALNRFDRAGRENLPAGIHFISGPSRSADIENDLTIGVHGPGIVYALIVGS